MSMSIFKIVGW